METDSPDALPKSESGTLYFVEGDPSLLPEEGNSSQDLESNASSSGGSMKLPKETLNHPANIHTVCLLLLYYCFNSYIHGKI